MYKLINEINYCVCQMASPWDALIASSTSSSSLPGHQPSPVQQLQAPTDPQQPPLNNGGPRSTTNGANTPLIIYQQQQHVIAPPPPSYLTATPVTVTTLPPSEMNQGSAQLTTLYPPAHYASSAGVTGMASVLFVRLIKY